MSKFFPVKLLNRLKRSPRLSVKSSAGRVFVFPFKMVSLMVIVLLVILSVFLALRSDLFLVRDFKVTINGSSLSKGFVDESSIRSSLQKYLSQSIFFVQSTEVEKAVTGESLVIENAKIAKLFPSTLIADITLREAVAEVENEESKFLIDKNGFIFALSPSNIALPHFAVKTDQKIFLGQTINSRFLAAAIQLIKGLQEKDLLKIKSFSLQDNESIVVTTDDGLIIYFKSQDISSQLLALEGILLKAKTEKGKLVKVDFRYERPVVVFQ